MQQVQATKPISRPGMTKTCSAKKRDSVAPAMIGPPSISLTSRGPDERDAAGDRRADPEPPVRVLIEAQDLAGEGHAERHRSRKHADDPGQLARILVGAEQEHLHHVDEHDRDHEVRAPAVQRAEEPAERDLVVQGLQAAPGLVRRRHVDERQADAGHELQAEDDQRGAAEDVRTSSRVLRGTGCSAASRIGAAELQALVEPGADLRAIRRMAVCSPIERARSGSGRRHLARRDQSSPSSILYRYSNSPRCGGPEARGRPR